MNIILLILSSFLSFAFLLFEGDIAWFTKETFWVLSSFLTSVVIYNLTRRRIYKIRVLGFLYFLFWSFSLLFHIVDKTLMSFGIYILSDLVFYTMPFYITILCFAFWVLWKIWKKRHLNLIAGK